MYESTMEHGNDCCRHCWDGDNSLGKLSKLSVNFFRRFDWNNFLTAYIVFYPHHNTKPRFHYRYLIHYPPTHAWFWTTIAGSLLDIALWGENTCTLKSCSLTERNTGRTSVKHYAYRHDYHQSRCRRNANLLSHTVTVLNIHVEVCHQYKVNGRPIYRRYKLHCYL